MFFFNNSYQLDETEKCDTLNSDHDQRRNSLETNDEEQLESNDENLNEFYGPHYPIAEYHENLVAKMCESYLALSIFDYLEFEDLGRNYMIQRFLRDIETFKQSNIKLDDEPDASKNDTTNTDIESSNIVDINNINNSNECLTVSVFDLNKNIQNNSSTDLVPFTMNEIQNINIFKIKFFDETMFFPPNTIPMSTISLPFNPYLTTTSIITPFKLQFSKLISSLFVKMLQNKKPSNVNRMKAINDRKYTLQFVHFHMFEEVYLVYKNFCAVCGLRINFAKYAFKCKVCSEICHLGCQKFIITSCAPQTFKIKLTDYCPSSEPFIPNILFRCCREIERRGISTSGLYKISFPITEIMKLMESFQNEDYVDLSEINIHVIAGVVKQFLKQLREPICTNALKKKFTNIVKKVKYNSIKSEICYIVTRLPQPNLDTLAFLMQHFQYIANANDSTLSSFELAIVFSSSIIGYETKVLHTNEMFKIISKVIEVTYVLITLKTQFWCQIVSEYTSNLLKNYY